MTIGTAGQKLLIFLVLGATVSFLSVTYQLGMQSPRTAAGAGAAAASGGSRGSNAPALRVQEIDGLREIATGVFRITDPRPLAGIAELLQRKFGIAISYEEEILQYSGDMVSAADLPGNREAVARNPGWKAPLVPRLGDVDLSIPPHEIVKQIADPTPYILQAIESHQRNSNVGGFKVVNLGPFGFSIVMDKLTDKSGQNKTVVPVLDTLVSFPDKDRSLGETLGLVSQGVAAAGKAPFIVGGPGSESFFEKTHVQIGANNEPARTVLAKALRIPGHELFSWNLSSLPGGFSVLTVQLVNVEIVDARGNVGYQTVMWPRSE